MTLDLRQVALCDRCRTAVVLQTRDIEAAKRAYQEAGWRVVVEDRGRELLCRECLATIPKRSRDALIERGARLLPSVTLSRPRYRPGVAPCAHCGDLVGFDGMVVRMGKSEHVSNLYCDPCGVADARRRGYVAVLPTHEKRKGGKAAQGVPQASLL